MNRRSFLQSAALTGAALSLPALFDARASAARFGTNRDRSIYQAEAARLNAAIMSHFWDSRAAIFKAPVKSAETVDSDGADNNGYVFWPSVLGFQALVDGERNLPGVYAAQIWEVYSKGLQQYWNPSLNAYNAWLYFPGNADSYYDDNSWAVITLVEAHNATAATDPAHAAVYLKQAANIMENYIYWGWDSTDHPGGMRWGTDPNNSAATDRNTCSTAAAALAALMLAKAGVNSPFNTSWAQGVLQWLTAHLLGFNGLLQDGLAAPDWTPRLVYWSYNTGATIRAFVEHYRLTKSAASLAQATLLGQAAINRSNALYDGRVQNIAVRHWYDFVYFTHYLTDGLLQLAQVTPNSRLSLSLQAEAAYNAQFLMGHTKDADGLYWRSQRLYLIGTPQLKDWESLTGQTITLDADPAERSQEPAYANVAPAQRPLVKTLLANASAARLFWLMSRV